MRITVQLCLLLAVFASAYAASSIWGVRNTTDVIILTRNVVRPAIANKFQTIFFDIPESNHSNSKVISAIYLEDRFQNSSGPANALVSGGPGWTYASVQMRTSTSVGLNVTVVAYGKADSD